jgi:hypothetical protein
MAHAPHHHHHDDVHTHREREYHVVERDPGSGIAVVVGIILAVVLAIVLLWFLFSANLFNTGPGTTSPAQPGQSPSIDININGGAQPGAPAGGTAPGTGEGGTAPGGEPGSGTP